MLKKYGMDVNFIIFDFLKKFKIKNICDRLKFKKADEYAVIELLLVVLTIPLVLAKNINSLYNSEYGGLFNMSRSAFVIDDTTISKEAYKCEKVTTVYDHSSKSFVYGFKQVTLAYCDGKSIIPIDSSLHGETELSKKKLRLFYRRHFAGAAGRGIYLIGSAHTGTAIAR